MSSFPGIKHASQALALAMAGRIDAALGFPRCGRLAGTVTQTGGRHAADIRACACVSVTAPHASCPWATRRHTVPVELRSGEWACPADTTSRTGLSAPERALIVTIQSSEVKVT